MLKLNKMMNLLTRLFSCCRPTLPPNRIDDAEREADLSIENIYNFIIKIRKQELDRLKRADNPE